MSSVIDFNFIREEASQKDRLDPLAKFREEFIFPKLAAESGVGTGTHEVVYLAGNSLGLQPRHAKKYILQELEDWGKFGVEGHLHARNPWLPYHEDLTPLVARLVGALPSEVVVMNSLTVNLHLLMASFYQPTPTRYKIMIEGGAFPSDQYAVKSQIDFHGFDPKDSLIELVPRTGEDNLRREDILESIKKNGASLALVLIGNVNYRTGQAFHMKEIVEAAHKAGAFVGFDLAHGAGNLKLELHDDGADFAAWCSYKYLNAGPGAIAGAFVHERHAYNKKLPRFAGWWGHNKKTRFAMGSEFDVLAGAEGWQLSNPPIFQLAALKASLELFDAAGMTALRNKADNLTCFMEGILKKFPQVSQVTPSQLTDRGTQLSLRIKVQGKELLQNLIEKGVVCDFREPDIIRIAPVPLYTKFEDLVRFAEVLNQCL
jgi:kynureninase